MQINVPGLVFEDEDNTETIEENIEEPVPVPTRPDFIQAMPPPEEKSAFSKIIDTTLRGMGATSFQMPPVQKGEPNVIDVFEQRAIETTKRREDLIKDAGFDVGYQTLYESEVPKFFTGMAQVKSGFGLDKEQIEQAYISGLTKKPDGTDRKINFLYDVEHDPFLFLEGSMLVSVERDDGTMTPFGRPAAGVVDYTQSLIPKIAADTGASAATITAAYTAGRVTAQAGLIGRIASPFVALATLYAGGVFSEKLRNEAAEELGLKTEDDKNEFFNALKMAYDSLAAPVPFVGGELTKEEIFSGRVEAIFAGLPVTKNQIRYAAKMVSNKFLSMFKNADVNPNTFRSALKAEKYREAANLERLLPSQISAHQVLNRGVAIIEQTTPVVSNIFRKQMRSLFKHIEDIRDTRGGGDFTAFKKEFEKFKKLLPNAYDAPVTGQINAEMLLLFKQIRHLETQELYRIAHDEIGFKAMNLNKILDYVKVGRKPIVPTSETDKIIGKPSAVAYDDGMLNSIIEQLKILGKNGTLNRQQVTAGMKNYVDNIDSISSVNQNYYKTPAKLLHLYSMKLGQMSADIRKSFPDGVIPPELQRKLQTQDELREIIKSTIQNPIGADVTKLKSIQTKLSDADSFFRETVTTLDQKIIKDTISAATVAPDELQTIPISTLGPPSGGIPSQVPILTLERLGVIENYLKDRLNDKDFVKRVLNKLTMQQTDEAFAVKGKLQATKGLDLSPEDYEGLTALKNAFRIGLAARLKETITEDVAQKGQPTAVYTYLKGFNDDAKKLLGLSEIDEKILIKEASEFANLESTLAKNIVSKPDTTQLGIAISEIFKDPSNIEASAKSLLVVARNAGIKNQSKAIENIRKALIDFIFSKSANGGAVTPVTKNSAYGERGDFTLDVNKMTGFIELINENKTLKSFFDKETLDILEGVTNYAQVTKTTGADAGSALSGAQLIGNLYTLDPAKFISVVTRLGAQRQMGKVLTKESFADLLLGKINIYENIQDTRILKNIFQSDGYLGAVFGDIYMELDREGLLDDLTLSDRDLNPFSSDFLSLQSQSNKLFRGLDVPGLVIE